MPGLVAILCSGQGGQHPAMFELVADCPEAESHFRCGGRPAGQEPRRFVKEADSADLFSNLSGQILCCTQALAAWAALGTVRPTRAVFAGYSIGELAAWGVCRCVRRDEHPASGATPGDRHGRGGAEAIRSCRHHRPAPSDHRADPGTARALRSNRQRRRQLHYRR